MAGSSPSRAAQRQALVACLAAAAASVVGPRVTVEPLGDKAVSVRLDGGEGGTLVTHVAPWLPSLTRRRDLTRTASAVADAIHSAVEAWPGATNLGPRPPAVSSRAGHILVQFFGSKDEPLPVIRLTTGTSP